MSKNILYHEILDVLQYQNNISFLHPDYSIDYFNKYNYFLTKEATERLDKIYTYISKGVPIIIEGETGTSKSFSAEMICRFIYEKKKQKEKLKDKNKEEEENTFIKFNLSSDTTIQDLIKKSVKDKNYFSGINIIDGPLYKAFKNGIPLILEGINLITNPDILQFIYNSLKSKEINVEIPNIELIKQEMKQGFSFIGIKDKIFYKEFNIFDSGLYFNYPDLFSIFLNIKFLPFETEELSLIAELFYSSLNQSKKIEEKDKNFISDLIRIHTYCCHSDKKENNSRLFNFTIREILACIKAYNETKDPIRIIKAIYEDKYNLQNTKKDFSQMLNKFYSFKTENNINENNLSNLPEELRKCIYENKEISESLNSALFSLNLGRNVFIAGDGGSGKTMIAILLLKLYNINIKNEENDYYYYLCTNQTKYSDLIGEHKIKKIGDKVFYEWKDGFLVDSMKKGKIVVLDNLEQLNMNIKIRLSSIFDFIDENVKINEMNNRKFNLPENPLENTILIHKNFRIIFVSNIFQIYQKDKFPSSFLNRLSFVHLKDQLKNISIQNLRTFISVLFLRKDQNEVNGDSSELSFDFKGDSFENKKINNKSDIEDNIYYEVINLLTEKLFNNNNKINITVKGISRLCYSLKEILYIKPFQKIKIV